MKYVPFIKQELFALL